MYQLAIHQWSVAVGMSAAVPIGIRMEAVESIANLYGVTDRKRLVQGIAAMEDEALQIANDQQP